MSIAAAKQTKPLARLTIAVTAVTACLWLVEVLVVDCSPHTQDALLHLTHVNKGSQALQANVGQAVRM
jgi:hypothetical protein